MRQKYLITQKGKHSDLTIQEYAVIDKDLKNVASPLLREDQFSFLCEEHYDGSTIISSISQGVEALIDTLRTTNLYPIKPYAQKIAESVLELYGSESENSVELFFDDADLMVHDQES